MANGEQDQLCVMFHGVNVTVGETHILNDVYGGVQPGQLMAVMGPSGAGKTTLMNCLSGRQAIQSGEITLGGNKLSKTLRRKICYVLQKDIFFPNLTLLETLQFTAMLRLADHVPFEVKMDKLHRLIDDLDLRNCLHTPMGGMWSPGLSGGEIRRASIACELITDPTVILLDEPTSGLDYKTASSLVKLLKQYATQHNKTVISTLHQPSSQMFFLFDLLLLMCNGHSVYYGSPREVTQFFTLAGYPMEAHYNTADFILEKVRESSAVQEKIIKVAMETRNIFENTDSEKTVRSWNMLSWKPENKVEIENGKLAGEEQTLVEIEEGEQLMARNDKWPTCFTTQYKHLTVRAFKVAQSRVLNKFKIFETAFLCVFLSLIWFQLPRSEDTLRDRMGLIFYISMHWGFTPLFDAVTSFPGEKEVIHKERSGSWYRVSAYYLAKMTSELPMVFIQPLMFLTVVYWTTGLNNVTSFFATVGTIFVHSLVGQSIGLCIGIYAMDFSKAISNSTVIIMFLMLIGGFYTRNLPFWMDWAKYLAFLHYTFHCLMYLEFYNGGDILCYEVTSATKSLYPSCYRGNSTESPTIPSQEVLFNYGIDQPFWVYFLPLFAFLIVFRLLGYVLLRFHHNPTK